MYRNFWSKVAVVQKGADQLPCCDLYNMHIPEGRLIKHSWPERCNNNSKMRWQRRDVANANKCTEVTFSLIGGDEVDIFEGVEVLNYLGRPLERSDEGRTAVLGNIRKSRQVLGHRGKFLWRKRADTSVLSKFYRTVV